MGLVVMGASGAGKTTLGQRLAEHLGARFVDADDHHPPESRAKMAAGVPLTEGDRGPWLAALRQLLDEARGSGERVVLACSTLRRDYRERLGVNGRERRLIFLDVPRDVLGRRLAARRGHFAGPALLDDQWATLEPPDPSEGALRLDGTLAPERLEAQVLAWLAG